MLKIENLKVVGLEEAIRGMRNPMNSWDKSDSFWTHVVDTETGMQVDDQFFVGENDLDLMKRLAASGSDHAKFRRMIVVYMDITAPLYWWKEFDIPILNPNREKFIETHDKKFWWQMIQLLPSSYNQRRTVMLNYEVLHNIYHARKNHKLDEWHVLCDQIEDLPYSELITKKPDNTQLMIDYVSALIADMTMNGASQEDIETAVKFSKIVLDIQKEKK